MEKEKRTPSWVICSQQQKKETNMEKEKRYFSVILFPLKTIDNIVVTIHFYNAQILIAGEMGFKIKEISGVYHVCVLSKQKKKFMDKVSEKIEEIEKDKTSDLYSKKMAIPDGMEFDDTPKVAINVDSDSKRELINKYF